MLSIPCCLSRMALDLTISEIKLQLFTVHTEIADNKNIWSLKAKQAISIEHNGIYVNQSQINIKGLRDGMKSNCQKHTQDNHPTLN